MMRAMLADRFKLVAHFEPREHAVFDLVLAREDKKLGAGLTNIDTDCAAVTTAAPRRLAQATAAASPRLQSASASVLPANYRRPAGRQSGDGQGRAGDLMEGEVTMDSLATALRLASGRFVVDKTGLTRQLSRAHGLRHDRHAGTGCCATPIGRDPVVFTAVREQLGLKLESSKTLRDTLIIDRLERPTEN